MTRLPDTVLELAAAQHGVIARWQLRRHLSCPTIDNRVARGELDRLDVRLATPTDALLESALFRPQVRDRSLRLAKDQLAWRNLVDAGGLLRRMNERGSDDPAVRAFLEAMDGDDLRSESERERGLGGALTRLDPAPEPQVWVTPHRRVDWYLRLLRLAWEYLGDVDHAGGGARRADANRDDELGVPAPVLRPA